MIIVSITGPRMSDALTQMASSAKYADAFEFRLDRIRSPELAVLMLSTSKPVVATCRPAWDGGGFTGSEEERMEILSAASLLGADYVDIELATDYRLRLPFLARRKETGVIVSYHLAAGKKPDPGGLYRRMRAVNADVIKFAFHATDAWENQIAFQFLSRARRDRIRAVAIAMGEAGEPSRVLYRVFGGWATYAGTEDGRTAAPGQMSARTLKEIFRSDRLTSLTSVFGVVGNPVRQSKGIFIHNRLLVLAGKNGVYCRFLVKDLRRFMTSVAPLLQGFSVTLPHKRAIMQYVDESDELARRIGAANTVVRRRGRTHATNTDAPGALDAIERLVSVRGKTVLLLGAGGAARAIAYEARNRGASVIVANRTRSKGKRLAADFGIECVPWDAIGEVAFDILVNATSAGMTPYIQKSPVPGRLLRDKIVFDAVYDPPMTRLLRSAVNAGAQIVQGTEMYLNQAARQFKLYTGVSPDIRVMRKILSEQE